MIVPEQVTRQEVEKISSLSPAHRVSVKSLLKTGRWVIANNQNMPGQLAGR